MSNYPTRGKGKKEKPGLLPTFDIIPGPPRQALTPTQSTEKVIITKVPDPEAPPAVESSDEFDSVSESGSSDDEKGFTMLERSGPDGKINCVPCPSSSSQLELDSDQADINAMPSLLDYDIFKGLISHQEGVRSETDAFVPVGGMVAPEQKRKEFMEYLKTSGFIRAIANMFLSLWDEPTWPDAEQAVNYYARCLGYKLTIHDDMAENTILSKAMRVRIARLERENDLMRRHLDNFETTETAVETLDPTSFPPILYLRKQETQNKDRKMIHIFKQFGTAETKTGIGAGGKGGGDKQVTPRRNKLPKNTEKTEKGAGENRQ